MLLAFAAILVAALGIAYQQHVQNLLRRQLIADVVDRHVMTLASANMVDVVSSDRHTVKPWFQGKLPFSFNLPELSGSPFALVGGRMTFLNQSAGAELIYDVRQHHISVLIFPEQAAFRVLPVNAQLESAAMHVETWTQAGLRYFVVGDASVDDLKALSDLIRRSAS
jgi:anti-sigma factor RsiW